MRIEEFKGILTVSIIILFMLVVGLIAKEEIRKEQAQDEQMEHVLESLRRLNKLEAEMQELEQRIDDFLDKWTFATFESTAYAPYDNQSGICSIGGSIATALGYTPGAGKYAVDFDVIPKHARMYVQGEGIGIAADTGGGIRGHRVDIYRSTYRGAMDYGRRQVIVAWER